MGITKKYYKKHKQSIKIKMEKTSNNQ